MSYKVDELRMKDDSPEEQERTREIFLDLKEKATKGEELSEHEKEFFCQGVVHSKLDDGVIEDYPCCSEYKFKTTYLTYFQDLTGYGEYEKLKGFTRYVPERKEILSDLDFLEKMEIDWKRKVQLANHSDAIMQHAAKEARDDLRNLEITKGKLLFRRDHIRHRINKKRILLQSKYIYLMVLEIFESYGPDDFKCMLNGQEIEINEYSFIHILNRHFAQITKPVNDKSFHIEDFDPRRLNIQLKEILKQIDESELLKDKSIKKLVYRYKDNNYLLWINEHVKQEKGKGNVPFLRLDTFYLVQSKKDQEDLEKNYELKEISDELSVFLPK